jgi:solute carrier family 25 (mitochondrial phosphate transporter), member 3
LQALADPLDHVIRKMFSSLFETARKNPISGPLSRVQCEEGSSNSLVPTRTIQAADTSSGDACEFGSPHYFLLCGLGGIVSCGSTHTFVVPLDLVKCRLQVDQAKYKNLFHGFKVSVAEEGARGLAKGWAPTLFGYSAQVSSCFALYFHVTSVMRILISNR